MIRLNVKLNHSNFNMVRALSLLVLSIIMMGLVNVAWSCVDLNDPSTYGSSVIRPDALDPYVYQIVGDTTLCTGEYNISKIIINSNNIVFDGNGSVLHGMFANNKDFYVDGENITFENVVYYSSHVSTHPYSFWETNHLVNSVIKNNEFHGLQMNLRADVNDDSNTPIIEHNLIYNNTFNNTGYSAVLGINVNHHVDSDNFRYAFNDNIISNNKFFDYLHDEIYLDYSNKNHIICNYLEDTRDYGEAILDDSIDLNYHTKDIIIDYNRAKIISDSSAPNPLPHGGFIQYEQQLEEDNNTFQYNWIYYDNPGGEIISLRNNARDLNFYKNKFLVYDADSVLVYDPSYLTNSSFVDNIICSVPSQSFDSSVNFVNNSCDNGADYDCIKSCSDLTPEELEPYACPIEIDNDTITLNGSVEINPGQLVLRTLDDLYCVANISEIADDEVTVDWYRNGVYYSTEAVTCIDTPGDPYQHCVSSPVSNIDTLKDDVWSCNVTATVSGHETYFNTGRSIENTLPSVPTLITPISHVNVVSPVSFDWSDSYDPDVDEGTDSLTYDINVMGPTFYSNTGLSSSNDNNIPLSIGEYQWQVTACDMSGCSDWSDFEMFNVTEPGPTPPARANFTVYKSYDKRCVNVNEPVIINLTYNRSTGSHEPIDMLFLIDHSGSMPRIEDYQPDVFQDIPASSVTKSVYTADLEQEGEIYLSYYDMEIYTDISDIEFISPSGERYSVSDGTMNCTPFIPDDSMSVQCRLSYTHFEPGEWTFNVYHDYSFIWSTPRILVSQSVEKIKKNLKTIISHLDPDQDRFSYVSFGGPEVIEREFGLVDPVTDSEKIDDIFFPLSRMTDFTSAFPFAKDYLENESDGRTQIIIFSSDGVLESYENLSSIESTIRSMADDDNITVLSVQPFVEQPEGVYEVNTEFLINVSDWGNGDYYNLSDLSDSSEMDRLINDVFGYHDVPANLNVTIVDALASGLGVVLNETATQALSPVCYNVSNVIYCPEGVVDEGDSGYELISVIPTMPGVNISLNTNPSGINITGDYNDFIDFNQPLITVCQEGYHCTDDYDCAPNIIPLSNDKVISSRVEPNPAYTNDSLVCYVKTNVTSLGGADLHIKWEVSKPIDNLGLNYGPWEPRPEYDQTVHVNYGINFITSNPVTDLHKHDKWMCIPYFMPVALTGPQAIVINRPPGPVTDFLPDVTSYTCNDYKMIAWLPGKDPDNDTIVGYRVYFGKQGTPLRLIDDTNYASYNLTGLEPGNTYCYQVDEWDGEAYSNKSQVRCFDAKDCSCPYIDNVTLSPDPVYVYHDVVCSAHLTDPRFDTSGMLVHHDDGTIGPPDQSPYNYTYQFTWYFYDGAGVEHYTFSNVTNLSYSMVNGFTQPGNVTCQVCVQCAPPYDDSACVFQGCMNDTIYVGEIPVAVKDVVVSPKPAYTNDDIFCNISLNESITRNITVKWKLNDAIIKTYDDYTCVNGNCNVTLDSLYTHKHDNITCIASDEYGQANDSVVVKNTPPTMPFITAPHNGAITLNDWMDTEFFANDADEDNLRYYVFGGHDMDPGSQPLIGNTNYYDYADRLGSFNWTGLTPGKYYIHVRAFDGEDYSKNSFVVWFVVKPIANLSVTVNATSGMRDYPDTFDVLSCKAEIDPHTVSSWPVNVTFTWYKDGNEFTSEVVPCDDNDCDWATVIVPDQTDKFENWSCKAEICTDNSGGNNGADEGYEEVCNSDMDGVIIQNIPPDKPLLIAPEDDAIILADTPTDFIVNGDDLDDDSLEYHVWVKQDGGAWNEMDVVNGYHSITTVHSMPVGMYEWKARTYDGHNWSDWSDVHSFSTVVHPEVIDVSIESDNDGVDPSMLETTDDLICKSNISGLYDGYDVIVNWYKDGAPYSSAPAVCSVASASASGGVYICASDIVPHIDTVKHDEWTCDVIACNHIYGNDYCDSGTDNKEINNLPPSVPDLVSPDDNGFILGTELPDIEYPGITYLTVDGDVFVEHGLNLDVTDSFDYDADPLTYSFAVIDESGDTVLSETSETSNASHTMLPDGNYTWWVNVTDGEATVGSDIWHFNVNINHPPRVQAQIVPVIPKTGDYIMCDVAWLWDEDNEDVNMTFYVVNVTDPDNPISYYAGQFYLNSSDPDTYVNDEYYGGLFHSIIGNYTHAHDIFSTPTVPVHKGERWMCTAFANDTHIVTKYSSPVVEVANTPPEKPVIWHAGAVSGEMLYWNKSIDIDGDPVTYYVYGRRESGEDDYQLLTTVLPDDTLDTFSFMWGLSETAGYSWYVIASDGENESKSLIDMFTYSIGKGMGKGESPKLPINIVPKPISSRGSGNEIPRMDVSSDIGSGSSHPSSPSSLPSSPPPPSQPIISPVPAMPIPSFPSFPSFPNGVGNSTYNGK